MPHLWHRAGAWAACESPQRQSRPRWPGRTAGCCRPVQQCWHAAPALGRGAAGVAAPAVWKGAWHMSMLMQRHREIRCQVMC